jgi:hypothetical protein
MKKSTLLSAIGSFSNGKLSAIGVALAGEGKQIRKATACEQPEVEAALSRIGFAGCASQASDRHWSAPVAHRFLRQGKISYT